MKITIFDNEGVTIDRYTVVMEDGEMYSITQDLQGINPVTELGNVALKFYFFTIGYNWQEGRTIKGIKQMIKTATAEQVEIFKRSPSEYYGNEVSLASLSKPIQETILEISILTD
jgi:hypothetical protein